MGLLAPLFLLGGLLVAAPLLIHLTRRRRPPIRFPSFLFLDALAATARRKRRRVRDLPLLLARCLAILLLALAFAEPHLEGAAGAALSGEGADRALLVDRSLSMRTPGRAAAAREAAEAEIAALGPADRAIIVAFDARAEALTELTGDRAALEGALAQAGPGDGGTRIAAALGLAARVLPETAGRRREVILISDLQRSAFPDGRPGPSLPPGVSLRVIRIGEAAPNFYAASASVRPEGEQELVVGTEVRYAGPEGSSATTAEPGLELMLRDQPAGAMRAATPFVAEAGSGSGFVESSPFFRPAEPLPAEVRLRVTGAGGPSGDALSADNAFRLVVRPETAVRIRDLGGASVPGDLYVREALEVGTAPAFALEAAPAQGEGAVRQALAGGGGAPAAHVALVRDPGRLDAGAVRALAEFVSDGGGLVVASGPRRATSELAEALAGILPAAPGATVDHIPPTRVGDFAVRHPLFDPFAGDSAGLGRASFFRYRRLDALAAGAEVLARFGDGRPALAVHSAGRAPDDGGARNRPRGPVRVLFRRGVERSPAAPDLRSLPPPADHLGRRLSAHAALLGSGGNGGPRRKRFGCRRRAPAMAARRRSSWRLPAGEARVLDETSALRLSEAGFYLARRAESSEFVRIAVNPPVAESDLDAFEAAEVEIAAIAREGEDAGEVDESEPEAVAAGAARVAGAPLWWPLLAGLGLLLAVETRLARA